MVKETADSELALFLVLTFALKFTLLVKRRKDSLKKEESRGGGRGSRRELWTYGQTDTLSVRKLFRQTDR